MDDKENEQQLLLLLASIDNISNIPIEEIKQFIIDCSYRFDLKELAG